MQAAGQRAEVAVELPWRRAGFVTPAEPQTSSGTSQGWGHFRFAKVE